jgi:cbb3-type cytochrome oxidase maturation protein
MSVVIILILASLAVALLFLAAFVWSVRSGQYDDTLTPSLRMLAEDDLSRAGDKAVPLPALKQKPRERQKTNNL